MHMHTEPLHISIGHSRGYRYIVKGGDVWSCTCTISVYHNKIINSHHTYTICEGCCCSGGAKHIERERKNTNVLSL